MLTKLLFTAAVVLAVFWMVQMRRRQEMAPPQRVVEAPGARGGIPIGWLATAVVVVMVGVAGSLLYGRWQDRHQVLQVSVVDTATGKATHYRAYRGDIGERQFVTVNGVRVVLAETDRLESSAISAGRN